MSLPADLRKGVQVSVFNPPPVLGLGTLGGFKFQIEDHGALGYVALNNPTNAFIKATEKDPALSPMLTYNQVAEPATGGELIVDEIQVPALVG